MKPSPTRVVVLILTLLFVMGAILALGGGLAAQSGGPYDLSWSVIGGGGGSFSSGGDYLMGGTVGQNGEGRQSGGIYQLEGGFWQCFPLVSDSCTAAGNDNLVYLPLLINSDD
jgi:hypothetical protein